MVWLAWLLAVAGVALAYVVVLASGMKSVPRMGGGDALFALALPALAALASAAAGAVLPSVLAGLSAAYVAAAYIGQPDKRRLRARLLGAWAGAPFDPHRPQNAARHDLPPWGVRLRRRKGTVRIDLRRGAKWRWRQALPDPPPVTDLGSRCVALTDELCAVALGRDVSALRVADGEPVWSWSAEVTPLWLLASQDVPEAVAPGFIAVGPGLLCALDIEGHERWRREVPDVEWGTLEPGLALFFGADGSTRRFRLADGQPAETSPEPPRDTDHA